MSNPTGVDFAATASYTLYPTTASQCMRNGCKNYTNKTGMPFKNQGECVKVASS